MASDVGGLVSVTLLLATLVFVGWAPLLYADRVRALFEGWPTGNLAANYSLAVVSFVTLHVLSFLAVVAAEGRIGGISVFRWLTVVVVAVPFVAWAVCVVSLPRFGDWNPADGGIDGRLVLAAGAAWYAFIVGVATLLLLAVAVFAAMPM